MIGSCPNFWDQDHWRNCDKCEPYRKQLKATIAGFATFEDWESKSWDYFKICDNCNNTFLTIYHECPKCLKDTNIRTEKKIIDGLA